MSKDNMSGQAVDLENFDRDELVLIFACGTLNGLVDKGVLEQKGYVLADEAEGVYKELKRRAERGTFQPTAKEWTSAIQALKEPPSTEAN